MLAPLLAAGSPPAVSSPFRCSEAQADEVIAAYAPYIVPRVGATQEGWVRLEGGTRTGRAMILARCPACATTFRVRPEQLRLARQGGRPLPARLQRPLNRPCFDEGG